MSFFSPFTFSGIGGENTAFAILWRGTWSASAYNKFDAIGYNGAAYIANATTISTDVPGVSSKWDLWINQGTTAVAYKNYGAVFDGGGSAIAANKKVYVRIPNSGVIIKSYIFADVSGTISIEVWKDTFANFPPLVADKISASAPIALSSAQKSEDTTLTGWTTAVTAGDVLCFNVSALATSITWCAVGVVVS
jgi:hypothetical protein